MTITTITKMITIYNNNDELNTQDREMIAIQLCFVSGNAICTVTRISHLINQNKFPCLLTILIMRNTYPRTLPNSKNNNNNCEL